VPRLCPIEYAACQFRLISELRPFIDTAAQVLQLQPLRLALTYYATPSRVHPSLPVISQIPSGLGSNRIRPSCPCVNFLFRFFLIPAGEIWELESWRLQCLSRIRHVLLANDPYYALQTFNVSSYPQSIAVRAPCKIFVQFRRSTIIACWLCCSDMAITHEGWDLPLASCLHLREAQIGSNMGGSRQSKMSTCSENLGFVIVWSSIEASVAPTR
jgi:hypothetical protein